MTPSAPRRTRQGRGLEAPRTDEETEMRKVSMKGRREPQKLGRRRLDQVEARIGDDPVLLAKLEELRRQLGNRHHFGARDLEKLTRDLSP